MISAETQLFTLAEIAAVKSVAAQTARAWFNGIVPDGCRIVDGKECAGYNFGQFPAWLQTDLEALGQRRGYRNGLHMLSAPDDLWQPSVPLRAVPQEEIDRAFKRRAVLLPFLERREHFDSLPQAEFESAGIAAHQRVFPGSAITGAGFQKAYDRVINRDRGQGNFTRLELYIEDRPRPGALAEAGHAQFDHTGLDNDVLPILHRVTGGPKRDAGAALKLTKRDKQAIWCAAYSHLNEIAAPGSKLREEAKRSVRTHLTSLFGKLLAGTQEALKRNFDRKIAALDAVGGKPSAIEDHRERCSGWHRAPEISDDHRNAILAQSVLNRGSRIAPAWRDYTGGQIPGIVPDKNLVDHYEPDPAAKSYVPRHVRNAVKDKAAAMESLHHSRHSYEQTGHLLLDDSKLHAGDVWSSDDVTLPVYSLVAPRTLIRGQTLISVDRRSRRVLGICLIPETSYDSIRILNHVARTADDHGLPRLAMEWERGIWRKSKLLIGDANADSVPPEEAELGLQNLGIKFIHRRSAKAKIVERVIGALQDLMEGQPGYCGRNEQTERFESFVKLKAGVESGRVDPAGRFYTFDQWNARLLEICAEYNRTPHGRGTLLDGLSPDEAYEAFQNADDPPVKLDADTRYLISTHRRAVKVTGNGIQFRIGNRLFLYRGGQSGRYVNQKMLLWFNAENTDVAYVTNLKRQNPFAVERVKELHPVAEDRETLADEMRKLREHQAPIRALYSSLKAQFKQNFRQNIVPADVLETGRAFDQAAQEINNRIDTVDKVRRLARQNGIALPDHIRNPDRVLEGVENEIARRKNQPTVPDAGDVAPSSGPKTYVLKPSPANIPSTKLFWSLCGRIEKIKPGFIANARHALTRRVIGGNPRPQQMTPEQLAKMIDVLSAMLREQQPAVP
jgi:hypothetical protein